jgi:3-oxoacyl-[acyl-carrier protein] reductase
VLVGRDSDNMRRAVEHCASLGPAHFVAADLSQPEAVTAAVAQILRRGVPHALVNCAGVVEREPVAGLTLPAYERQMNTNLLAPMWLARGLLPAMREAGRGRIVNVGSISATLGTAEQSLYNASKWALVGFTKCLAEELTNSGLMTVIVHPGAVDTDMLTGSRFAPRMTANDVATTLLHYAFDAPLAHNGAVIEMFGT